MNKSPISFTTHRKPPYEKELFAKLIDFNGKTMYKVGKVKPADPDTKIELFYFKEGAILSSKIIGWVLLVKNKKRVISDIISRR